VIFEVPFGEVIFGGIEIDMVVMVRCS